MEPANSHTRLWEKKRNGVYSSHIAVESYENLWILIRERIYYADNLGEKIAGGLNCTVYEEGTHASIQLTKEEAKQVGLALITWAEEKSK